MYAIIFSEYVGCAYDADEPEEHCHWPNSRNARTISTALADVMVL
jgi:hypothetical protein